MSRRLRLKWVRQSRLRFFVDHCVPVSVARLCKSKRHKAWTAHEAHLEGAKDEDLIAYAAKKQATLVTTNRDCALTGRRMALAQVVWLHVKEVDAVPTMAKALDWLNGNVLPDGRVLKVFKVAPPSVLTPIVRSRRGVGA